MRSGPTCSNTGGVWYVTGSSAACATPCPLLVNTCSRSGPFWRLQVAEDLAQAGQVVAVHRAEVAEAEFLEEHAVLEERLEPVAELFEGRLRHAADDRDGVEDLIEPPLAALVEAGHAALIEVLGQPAGARADGHLVVVEDDQDILAHAADVVERLEDDAAGQGPVADDRDRLAVLVAEQIVGRP